jgi:hypothetical protein
VLSSGITGSHEQPHAAKARVARVGVVAMDARAGQLSQRCYVFSSWRRRNIMEAPSRPAANIGGARHDPQQGSRFPASILC